MVSVGIPSLDRHNQKETMKDCCSDDIGAKGGFTSKMKKWFAYSIYMLAALLFLAALIFQMLGMGF